MVRRYPRLPDESYFVPSTERHISISQIYKALGNLKASALPGFHAISGCDTTGSLKGKRKLSYWKVFESARESALVALSQLGCNATVTGDIINTLEQFICRVYQPSSKCTTLADLRWSMFTTKQLIGEKLPPTREALIPAVKRANFQASI